jgi:DNA-binding transcriptional MerR regulator
MACRPVAYPALVGTLHAKCEIIRRFRDLDMPLDEIADVLTTTQPSPRSKRDRRAFPGSAEPV